ncbi:hypothetical protein C3495_05665 [Clostridiaceae bacterium 14S0207]|nr:hypothetical protein C3495_05665 [Clostridiaceae bacterium 14S0207]
MVYNAIDVAKYVINYSIEKENPVSNLKLQKLLYYIQAAFLVKNKCVCFNEEIEHWRHGPVVAEVYREYKIYFNGAIYRQQKGINICDHYKKVIEKVVDAYDNFEPWEMVDRTHEEDPWKETESNNVISKDKIKKYFKNNENRIFGGR